jgi:hypothetical protein
MFIYALITLILIVYPMSENCLRYGYGMWLLINMRFISTKVQSSYIYLIRILEY